MSAYDRHIFETFDILVRVIADILSPCLTLFCALFANALRFALVIPIAFTRMKGRPRY